MKRTMTQNIVGTSVHQLINHHDAKECPNCHESVLTVSGASKVSVNCQCGLRGPYALTVKSTIDIWNNLPR